MLAFFDKRAVKNLSLMFFSLSLLSLSLWNFGGLKSLNAAETLTYTKTSEMTIDIRLNGDFFAEYQTDSKGTPIIWPICTPSGNLITRGFPMIDSVDIDSICDPELRNVFANSKIGAKTANSDHVHHRSLWFNHGIVNGYDFWGPDEGIIAHQKFLDINSNGETVTIKTQNEWIPAPGAKPICEDVRTVTFGYDAEFNVSYIDYDIDVTALQKKVEFTDTKEGSFGFRTQGTLDVSAGKRCEKWGGHILNNCGDKDGDAWGKRASWVDYFGPVPKRLSKNELDQLGANPALDAIPLTQGGVIIMNHPTSFRYPSWYHVRDYGLFAVNPFGIHDFEPNAQLDGTVDMVKGDQLKFRYRVLLHDQELSADQINILFDRYKAKAYPAEEKTEAK